jgi:hypothetical protein
MKKGGRKEERARLRDWEMYRLHTWYTVKNGNFIKKAMPFIAISTMSQRIEFCVLASKPGSNLSDLCRRQIIYRRSRRNSLAGFSAYGSAKTF